MKTRRKNKWNGRILNEREGDSDTQHNITQMALCFSYELAAEDWTCSVFAVVVVVYFDIWFTVYIKSIKVNLLGREQGTESETDRQTNIRKKICILKKKTMFDCSA